MSHNRRSCPLVQLLRPQGAVASGFALVLTLIVGATAPGAARGEDAVPASIAPIDRSDAQSSFDRFARSWMEKMRRIEDDNRRKPKVHSPSQVSYRGYGDGFETELRPTKHPSTPYVGILRYTERLYTCSDARARSCSISVTTPVTEIFRFQGGKWIY